MEDWTVCAEKWGNYQKLPRPMISDGTPERQSTGKELRAPHLLEVWLTVLRASSETMLPRRDGALALSTLLCSAPGSSSLRDQLANTAP